MENLVTGSFKTTNVNDGSDARILIVETSGNVIGFDADNKAVPGQKIDIVALIQNIEGSPVFTAIPYIGEDAQTPITLRGEGNTRYITGEEWNEQWNRLIVSVSLGSFNDSTTIAKVQDGSGKDGQNAIIGLLTNEATTLSADENGNVFDFSTATGEFQIYDGLTKVTEGVSFAISEQIGASSTINQNGTYNVTAMTTDTASVTFKANYKGQEITKKLSLSKSRKGQPGKNANLLFLSTSNNVMVFDANNVAFPNQKLSIVAKMQNVSGTATFKAIPYIGNVAQSEIALSGTGNERYIMGENWDSRWTSLSVTATFDNLSDQTTIYKISEVKGSDGKNTIIGILTNESITISADSNGNVPDFTKATGTFQIYDGIELISPSKVTYAVQSQTGASVTIGTDGVYKVVSMSADTATAVFKATYGGVERTKQLSLAKSKAGVKGEAGNGIKTIVTQWQRSTNGQTPPQGEWLDQIPDVAPGEYLWTRITQTFDDNSSSLSYTVVRMGENGSDGSPGKDGVGIDSTTIRYAVSDDGQTKPTEGWQTDVPDVPQGKYLWTEITWNYSDGTSKTACSVTRFGQDGENGLSNDGMIFNSQFENFNKWPQSTMGWFKTQFTQAIQPETDKPQHNILKIGGDATSTSRYTFSRNIIVVPGTTIDLSFDVKLSRLFTSQNISDIRMFDTEHANSTSQADTVGGNSYIHLLANGVASAGDGMGEIQASNPKIANANQWYRYKVRFVVPNNVTNIKLFFMTIDNNASSFLFVRDPQAVIYKDLNANTRNFALDSRFPSVKTIGASTTRRKNIQLSRPTKAGEKYTIALDYSLISGTLTSQIQVVFADKNEAGKGKVLLNTSGNKNRLVGEIVATGEADHLQIFHGINGATTETTIYEFEKIMLNLGDKTFDYEQAPEDGFITKNIYPNSSWNVGKGLWVYSDDQFEILTAESDKPESPILHGKRSTINYQQAYQMPHPIFVNEGDVIHITMDYKELNRTSDSLIFAVRIFPEKDTLNSSANALVNKYITPSTIGWDISNISTWRKVEYIFRSTASGWLDIMPYDNDTTGNHESFYREIFLSNSGKYHGDWGQAQVDFANQIDGIPKVFTQASAPTDANLKNGDQWWVMSGNDITGFKVYGNGSWHDQTIDQAIINIVQLNAVNINGSIINGSHFINQFDILDSDTSKLKGITKIQDGYITQDSEHINLDLDGNEVVKESESHFRLSYGSFQSQNISYNNAGEVTSSSSSSLTGGYLNLTLKDSSGTYAGTLDAKLLTKTPWIHIEMASGFETAESNPPQYRITYNLDGSKTVNFRGQVKLKKGTMSPGRAYQPFKTSSGAHSLPAEARPKVTSFSYAPVGVSSGTIFGGQWAITPSGYFSLGVAQNNTTYAVLSPITYVID